jgi:hypothetical protein
MADEPNISPEHVEGVQESQQHRSQQSFSKSLLGGASEQNPFADYINVVADTPPSLPQASQPPADGPAASGPTSDSTPDSTE